ncbi:M15 family metallopeptidase [Thalassotalea sp. ND16A]|uniref:M15 family metallopeptidase n=1 Tax=Thalassotalea sp. ND16A TaxID=1535422 RepID=UPI000519FC4D|nr:M15 family metallopeptidase [Thalassotalea sp. ND16A]KGJ99603.1 hypothetical protein ND16A_3703 [Thalassotalea sp. ND16A]
MNKATNATNVIGLNDSHIHYFNEGLGIHKDMVAAFLQMQQAAAKDGFDLKIASGYRSFARQLAIFNAKLAGVRPILDANNQPIDCANLSATEKISRILLFSALPGGSRHHWGTDIDVYDPNLLAGKPLQLEPWEYHAQGPFAPLSQWLDENMGSFGFYRPYDKYRGGVAIEPWHLSYQPIAALCIEQLSIELLHDCIEQSDILNKEEILAMLDSIYQRFIINVGSP